MYDAGSEESTEDETSSVVETVCHLSDQVEEANLHSIMRRQTIEGGGATDD